MSSVRWVPYSLLMVAWWLAAPVGFAQTSGNDSSKTSRWDRFHGPSGQGYVAGGKLPTSLDLSAARWQVDLGSTDVGSPIVSGKQVFLLASDPVIEKISCRSIDLDTGKLLWKTDYRQRKHRTHPRNTLASSTPVANELHVFFAFTEINHTWLVCLDHDGQEVWKVDFGSWQSQHGFGTSPTLVRLGDQEWVVLLLSQQAEQLKPGQSPGQSRVVAVNALSGEIVWRSELTTRRSCYGVPAFFPDGENGQLVGANTGNGLFGLDLASGKMLWSKQVFEKRCCSTPIVWRDIAIGTTGSGGGGNELVAVRIPDPSSDEPQELYRITRNVPYVPTPVLKNDRLFMIDDQGVASCVKVETGDVIWRVRIGGGFSASPIIVGDRMLLIDLSGVATIIRAADQFKKLGTTKLGGSVGATPAYVNGRLILRVGSDLICL